MDFVDVIWNFPKISLYTVTERVFLLYVFKIYEVHTHTERSFAFINLAAKMFTRILCCWLRKGRTGQLRKPQTSNHVNLRR